MYQTDDVHVQSLRPLISPAILHEELPATDGIRAVVQTARDAVAAAVHGKDDRLVVIVGPCSVHDPVAALDYAGRLQARSKALSEDLIVIMRTYFEKPRTVVGWKGLINDPDLDGSFQINRGLRVARGLLRDVAALGLPTGTEFLDPISPQYVADLVSWGAIGARTTESQVHREMASGLSMPIGFKNGTRGTTKIAIDAVRSARHSHHFLGVTKAGLSAIVATNGNPDTHVILRGGTENTNYQRSAVASTAASLQEAGVVPRVMVDCSHANSGKDHVEQRRVAADLARQVAQGSDVFGVMLESFLVPGRQNEPQTYGQSITDACMGWDTTETVLDELAAAVRARR